MSNVIAFESANVPAHLRKAAAALAAADLITGVSAGYNVISIKGKTWAVVKGGERKVVLDSEREPVRSIKVVIVKGNPQVSKVFYAEGYSEGSDAKPTCYSNDGVAPAPDSDEKQSPKCATCKHNQWGSAVSRETGMAGKGKACADSRRLAVMQADLQGEPMLLRVPPASLKAVADYARALDSKSVPYNGVVTKLSFDPDAASPKLVLKFDSFLDENQYAQVQELYESDVVDQIIAKGPMPVGDGTTGGGDDFDAHDRQATAAPEPEPAPAPAPKPRARKAAPAPAPAPAEEETGAGFGGGDDDPPFDATPAPAPVAAKPKAAPAPEPQVAGDDLEADLANALGGFDD